MNKPLFSIVIPTKNRGFIVGNAIRSVTAQPYPDIEIIVVDNDDTDETKKVVDSFSDQRIKYYKTGNLSMPDNWEYGISKATGRYLIILQDKMVLKTNAIHTLRNIIIEKSPEVIKWQHDFFDEDTGKANPNFLSPKFDPHYIDSRYITSLILDVNPELFARYAPIGIDTCVYMEVVTKIQKDCGRLCFPISPDYTMAYQILNNVNEIYCIPDRLSTMGGIKYSNGVSFFKRGNLGKQFVREMNMKESDLYSLVPLPVLTTYNTLLNDYISCIGSNVKINPIRYVLYIYNELQRMEKEGVNIKNDMNEWSKFVYGKGIIFLIKIDFYQVLDSDYTWASRITRIIFSGRLIEFIHWKFFTKNNFPSILSYAWRVE